MNAGGTHPRASEPPGSGDLIDLDRLIAAGTQ